MIKPLTLLVMLWILLAPAGAQETGDDGPSGLSARGLAELNANLMRIAEALESLQVDQRVLLTLRRVELAEQRIAPLESRLRRARDHGEDPRAGAGPCRSRLRRGGARTLRG